MLTRRLALSFTLAVVSACSETDLTAAVDSLSSTGADGAAGKADSASADSGEPGSGQDDVDAGTSDGADDATNPADTTGLDLGAADGSENDVSASEDIAEPPIDVGAPQDAATNDDAAPADIGGPGPDDAAVTDAGSNDTDSTDTSSTVAPSDPGIAGTVKYTKGSDSISLSGGLFPTSIKLTVFTPNGLTTRPVVIFTHGFQLGAGDYDTLAEHLASWGYVVVLPDLGGGFTATHVEQRDKLVKVLDWVVAGADAASGPLAGVADTSKIVMAGHSMGGKLSFLVAADDKRPVAIFGVDPVDAAGGPIAMDPASFPSVTPERMGDIDVPFMVVGETTNSSGGMMGTPCAPAADNFKQYYDNATGPAAVIDFKGAFHMSWLDDPGCLVCFTCDKGTADDDTVKSLTNRYFVAFLKGVVEGLPEYLSWATGAAMQPDVTAGYVTVSTKNSFPAP